MASASQGLPRRIRRADFARRVHILGAQEKRARHSRRVERVLHVEVLVPRAQHNVRFRRFDKSSHLG